MTLLALIAMAAVIGTTTAPDQAVYVFNTYHEEAGHSEQRPANLVASEFTTMRNITWRHWAADSATGTGELTGSWCLPECQTHPYSAAITLRDVRRQHFTTFAITGDIPTPSPRKDTLSGHLPAP